MDSAKNFAKVTVSTAYDAAATSIVLSSGHGAKLPTAPFNAVWWNATDYADPSDDPNVEIVRVTAISTDTLTVTRAQESTSASTKNTASKTYKMIAGLTAKIINTDLANIPLNAPRGFLINGKLSVTVATNNLTVAIKTLAGNDPSAADPVYCRIGDTVRSITAALSVTKNAGTNWFNSGGSELATKEVDYFVYLGYNTTDGVVIGFARKSHFHQYNDSNTTSTNESYMAISTITNAAGTDAYEVIGRFAATLSATAAFNWSVPTFTNKNLIQAPIYDTRVLLWNPVITGYSSNPTSATYFYRLIGSTCFIHIREAADGTSNATAHTYTTPFKTTDHGFTRALCAAQIKDNSATKTAPGFVRFADAASNTLSVFLDFGETALTASGTSRLTSAQLFYEID
jgi:hypothetical protein